MSYKNTYILCGEKILTAIHCTFRYINAINDSLHKENPFTAMSGFVHVWFTVLHYL